MAFTTEFVMGAGGVTWDEIPVSGTTSGNSWIPLTTVSPPTGERWAVLVVGTLSGGGSSSYEPSMRIGSTRANYWPHGDVSLGAVVTSSTVVELYRSTLGGTTTFTGTVYVARL